jgi:hypothetical protein
MLRSRFQLVTFRTRVYSVTLCQASSNEKLMTQYETVCKNTYTTNLDVTLLMKMIIVRQTTTGRMQELRKQVGL